MPYESTELTFVTVKHPCSACVIVQSLLEEIITKVAETRAITVKKIVINNPIEISQVEGIEVEKLPAILINGEQVTAANLITATDLLLLIEQLEE